MYVTARQPPQYGVRNRECRASLWKDLEVGKDLEGPWEGRKVCHSGYRGAREQMNPMPTVCCCALEMNQVLSSSSRWLQRLTSTIVLN